MLKRATRHLALALSILLISGGTTPSFASDQEPECGYHCTMRELWEMWGIKARYEAETKQSIVNKAALEAIGELIKKVRAATQTFNKDVVALHEDFQLLQSDNLGWLTEVRSLIESYRPDFDNVVDYSSYQAGLGQVYAFQANIPPESMVDEERKFIANVNRVTRDGLAIRSVLVKLGRSRGMLLLAGKADIAQHVEKMGELDKKVTNILFDLRQMQKLVLGQRGRRGKAVREIGKAWLKKLRAALFAVHANHAIEIMRDAEYQRRGLETYLKVSGYAWESNRARSLLNSYNAPILARRQVMKDIQRFNDIAANLDTYPIDEASRESIRKIVVATQSKLARIHADIYGANLKPLEPSPSPNQDSESEDEAFRVHDSVYVQRRINWVNMALSGDGLSGWCLDFATDVLDAIDPVESETLYIKFMRECR